MLKASENKMRRILGPEQLRMLPVTMVMLVVLSEV